MSVDQELATVRRGLQEQVAALERIERQFTGAGAPGAPGAPVLQQGVDYGRELVLGDVFDPSTHYDADYYADGLGLLYTERNGAKRVYRGPARDWSGFDLIGRFLHELVCGAAAGGDQLLSIGCGYGSDVARFRRVGWPRSIGVDISDDVAATVPADLVVHGDILDPSLWDRLPFAPSVLCAWDLWEHIYLRDIPGLLEALWRYTMPGALMFACICTTSSSDEATLISPGEVFTPDNSWLLCSGHVTMQPWPWWARMFDEHGWSPRHDLAQLFQIARHNHPGFAEGTPSWSPRHFLVAQRG